MSRTFTKNLSNHMSLGTNQLGPILAGAPAVSLHAWVNFASASSAAAGNNGIFRNTINSTATSGIQLNITVTGGNNRIRLGGRSVSGDTFRSQVSNTNLATGTWYSLGGVLDYAGDHIYTYLNGAADGDSAQTFTNSAFTNGTPTVADRLGCTDPVVSGTNDQLDGLLAEMALWNVDIGLEGYAALAKGTPPWLVRPANLIFYWPLWGDASPESELVNQKTGAITGALAKAEHALLWYPPAVWSLTGVDVVTEEGALTLARSLAAAQVATLTAQRAATLTRSEAVTQSAFLSTPGNVSLTRQHAATASAQALAEAAQALTRILATTSTGAAAAAAGVTAGRVETISPSATLDAQRAATLSRNLATTPAAAAAAEASSALSRSLGATPTGEVQALASIALGIVKLIEKAGETGITEVSLTLSRALATTLAGDAAAEALITTLTTLGVPVSASTMTGQALILSRTEGFSAATIKSDEVELTLSLSQALSHQPQAAAEAELTLLEDRAVAMVAAAAAAAEIDIIITKAVATSGATVVISIVTPLNRTYTVPAEVRTYTVPAESRVYIA